MKTKTKITQKSLIAYACDIPENLSRAVIRQSGGWQSFSDHASDIANYGASGGFSGWIYYTETVSFTRRNRAAIVELCESRAQDFGLSGPVELVKGFRCLSDATESEIASTLYGKGDGNTQVANALAWFALEELANAYERMSED